MAKDKFIKFLTLYFYNKYPQHKYPQMEQKQNRPYAQVIVNLRELHFAIPFRSNITHPHVFWTDKKAKCGVDLSKAVVILEPDKEIDNFTQVFLRPDEFKRIKGKEYRIKKMMEGYIETYRQAKLNQYDVINQKICQYSTLQYFEDVIFPNGIHYDNMAETAATKENN